MISCPQRRSDLARTLPQLQSAGLHPVVFADGCAPPSREDNRGKAEKAARMAIDQHADLLFCEDDIDLANDFPQALHEARHADQAVTFYLEKPHTHPAEFERIWERAKPKPIRPGFHPVRRFKGSWYGAQCVYLPHSVLSNLSFGVNPANPVDHWLRANLTRMLVALPNPVQHRNAPTLVNPDRKPRVSPTFHLAREGRWQWTTPASAKPTP